MPTQRTFSIHCGNIPSSLIEAQAAVLSLLSPRGWEHVQVEAPSHAGGMDQIIREGDDEILFFLDIDCLPLDTLALQWAVHEAKRGLVAGNAGASSHIDRGRHAFVAPSFLAFSRAKWEELGRPSMEPTPRGDVAEELSWLAGDDLSLLLPQSCVEPRWWFESQPFGLGTTFGLADEPRVTTYHAFCVRDEELPRRLFLRECDRIFYG